MGKRKNTAHDTHYYSDRIMEKLNRLNSASSAILEAPPGYGKTTAVRDYFERVLPQDTPVYWLGTADELPAACFLHLAGEIMKIDPAAGQRLFHINFPDAHTIGETCSALRSISCSAETYLVIEGGRNLFDTFPQPFLKALIEHGGKSLHIIILVHRMNRKILTAATGRSFLHIKAEDFQFTAEDIHRYFSKSGVLVTKENALSIFENTGGWPAAVHMQLEEYRDKGRFAGPGDVLYLMEKLVWTHLTNEEHELFMYLAPFEEITAQQICALLGFDEMPGYVQDALENPFIQFVPSSQKYVPNRIFRKLLLEKCRERGEAFEKAVILRAGDLYLSEGKVYEATSLYRQVKDYGRILSLNLSPLILERAGDEAFAPFLQELAKCPYETKREHPLSMLNIAWGLKSAGLDDDFCLLMNELHPIACTQNKEPDLAGEWLLLSSFIHHPDLDRMTSVLKEAKELLNGRCSQVILPQSQAWLSIYTPISEFYAKPGEADIIAEKYEEFITLFTRLTGAQGRGADVLFRSVLAYQRGEIDNAKILAYKAMYLAQNSRQTLIFLGAIHELGQIALHMADAASWQNAVNSLEQAGKTLKCSLTSRMFFDISCALLLNELQQMEGIADWLKKGDFPGRQIPPALIPPAVFVHASYLYQKGDFSQLIGFTEAWHETYSESKPFFTALIFLITAAAYMQRNDYSRACNFMRLGAKKILPDGLIFPFVSFSWIMKGFIDKLIEEEYPDQLANFIRIKERFASGWEKLYRDLNPEQLPESLTAREREVALLASRGLRNNEIAKKLQISENTIRAHLRTTFQKLDVDRRAKLAEKLK